ncbi:MAG: hypothetical protein ACI9QL_003011 [Candidatus Omnitrophota bacterium]|jgi:hypothetical protein
MFAGERGVVIRGRVSVFFDYKNFQRDGLYVACPPPAHADSRFAMGWLMGASIGKTLPVKPVVMDGADGRFRSNGFVVAVTKGTARLAEEALVAGRGNWQGGEKFGTAELLKLDDPRPLRTANQTPLIGKASSPETKAARVRVEIARDEAFLHIEQSRMVGSLHTFRPDVLPAGRYFFRWTPLDAQGIPGFSSASSVLTVHQDLTVKLSVAEPVYTWEETVSVSSAHHIHAASAQSDTSVTRMVHSVFTRGRLRRGRATG